jgi:ABC-2 type transport system permease protein
MPASPTRVALVNSLHGIARGFRAGGARHGVASAVAALSALAFAAGSGWATAAVLDAAGAALPHLPHVRPEYLVERVLSGGFLCAAFLLALGSLTTGVSTLFLSVELPALVVLPVPHARIFRRQLLKTVAAASAPVLLLALPVLVVAAARAPRPALAAAAGLSALAALALFTGTLGSAAALLLVRLVPPRRALLLAAFVSAIGLSAALIGFRAARPERLFDPVAAIELLESLGKTPPPSAGLDPVAHAARAVTRAFAGNAAGVSTSLLLLATSAALLLAVVSGLAPAHFRALEESWTGGAKATRRTARMRPVLSLDGALLRAEAASVLREASTPAQLGSLLAVFVLQFLNLGILPAGDAAARDVLAGLQTGLALFLVSALSLRFCYPAVSGDSRAALLLRSLPLSPSRHLAYRYAVRAAPSALAGLILVVASLAVLKPPNGVAVVAIAAGLLGSLALPALHLGLGALFPRYDAPNAIAVALGPGGLLALVLSTAISLGATVVVSDELRLFAGALLHATLRPGVLLFGWSAFAVALGASALVLGAQALSTGDLAGG